MITRFAKKAHVEVDVVLPVVDTFLTQCSDAYHTLAHHMEV